LYDKPTIGDDSQPIQPEDILRANDLMKRASLLALLVGCLLRAILWLYL
jgi:cobalamin biosynthesis protein CobD/CbiB